MPVAGFTEGGGDEVGVEGGAVFLVSVLDVEAVMAWLWIEMFGGVAVAAGVKACIGEEGVGDIAEGFVFVACLEVSSDCCWCVFRTGARGWGPWTEGAS
jgi:hypothetical protein